MSTIASASRVLLASLEPRRETRPRRAHPARPVAAVGVNLTQRVALGGGRAALATPCAPCAPCATLGRSRRALNTVALVNVELGPAAVLGASVMTSAIALYQVRASRPEVSRDQDVFFSSVGLLCGGILVFQGWRLDPLMLFGQLLTVGTAVAFASETIGLRQEILNRELADTEDLLSPGMGGATNGGRGYERDRRGDGRNRGRGGGGGGGGGAGRGPMAPLPPPRTRVEFDQADGWRDARNPGSTPWGREQQGGDEFVYDAGAARGASSYGGGVDDARGGGVPPGGGARGRDSSKRADSSESGGGYMDGFQEGRGSAPGGGVRREGRGDPGGGGKYDDSFGPGRFGDDNDDWEL